MAGNTSQSREPPPDEPSPDKTPHRPGLMRLTLAGIPELEQFKDDAQAREAIAEIEKEASSPVSLAFGIFFVAGAAMLTMFAVRWGQRFVNWPPLVEDWLPFLSAIAAFLIALRWAHRSGAPEALRQKLLNRGIPICIACGYSLRGLTADAARCPECGRPFEPRVTEILAGSPTPIAPAVEPPKSDR